MPCEATGPSKTTRPGPSTGPPRRISHGCEPDTEQGTWPSSATSLSIWFAKPRTNDQSRDAAKEPHGTRNTFYKSSGQLAVNLDSVPCGGDTVVTGARSSSRFSAIIFSFRRIRHRGNRRRWLISPRNRTISIERARRVAYTKLGE